MTKCPACETESKPGTSNCPNCGSDLSGVPQIYDDPNSNAKAMAMLFYALAGMMGFFAFFFLLIWFLAGTGFLIAGVALVIVSFVFFLIGRGIAGKERKRIEHLRNKWVLNGKCDYCGIQNAPGNRRCLSCGAPLFDHRP